MDVKMYLDVKFGVSGASGVGTTRTTNTQTHSLFYIYRLAAAHPVFGLGYK